MQAGELFDAASRCLLFPLKRAVADVLLPHLENVSPAELCNWLILSDMYGSPLSHTQQISPPWIFLSIACDFDSWHLCIGMVS